MELVHAVIWYELEPQVVHEVHCRLVEVVHVTDSYEVLLHVLHAVQTRLVELVQGVASYVTPALQALGVHVAQSRSELQVHGAV